MTIKLEELVDHYARQYLDNDPDATARLEAVIYSSPELIFQLQTSIDRGDFRQLTELPPHVNAGATYQSDTQTIALNAGNFKIDSPDVKYNTIFQLGHEISHSDLRAESTAAHQAVSDSFHPLYQSGRDYDVTGILDQNVQFLYHDEARATLSGWNALINHLHAEGKTVDEENLIALGSNYTKYFFTETYNDNGERAKTINPALQLNDDYTLEYTPQNIAILEEKYSQLPGTEARLGDNADSSYTDYRAGHYLSWMCESHSNGWENHPQLAPDEVPKLYVNFENIGVGTTPDALQNAGMSINAPSGSCNVYDTNNPDEPITFYDRQAIVVDQSKFPNIKLESTSETTPENLNQSPIITGDSDLDIFLNSLNESMSTEEFSLALDKYANSESGREAEAKMELEFERLKAQEIEQEKENDRQVEHKNAPKISM